MTTQSDTRTRKECIETYIHAKDGNRPHLMSRAFAPDAKLAMDVRTGAISFPAAVDGLDAISQTLVSQFALRYENVYTFCIGDAPDECSDLPFECCWLVCMSEKDTGAGRIGHGRYEWRFASGEKRRTDSLRILIGDMAVLPASEAGAMFEWASRLPYPWCPADRLKSALPDIPVVRDATERLMEMFFSLDRSESKTTGMTR
jgi:hypothetical protein